FLSSTATSADEGALSVAVGAVVGLALAVVIGFGFYRGARIIDLRIFFKWTGIALIFIAGGLLSRAVHELVEIGVIGIGSSAAFDISSVLPHEEGIGQFLRAIFGYSSQPEWATLVTWIVYVVVVLVLYLRPVPPAAPKPVEVQPAA
ncbi:MAG TPA: FTR1 family protein, partial [Candidatus Saccharimonadia bacterium]|nr:FTR1 family protein [Candidatus Saccharimonadia bacterium]